MSIARSPIAVALALTVLAPSAPAVLPIGSVPEPAFCRDLARPRATTESIRRRRSDPTSFRIYAESVEGYNSLSKLIRDNPEHWWMWLSNYLMSSQAAPHVHRLRSSQGLIMADAHLGNYPMQLIDGRYRLAGMDEGSGRGPFILDFARLILTTKAIVNERDDVDVSVKVKAMFEAYLAGLQGRPMTRPELIREAESTARADTEQLVELDRQKYLRPDGQFKAHDRLEAVTDRSLREKLIATVEQATGRHVVDIAVRRIERGGSASVERYWLSLANPTRGGRRTQVTHEIVELKGRPYSDVVFFERNQPGFAESLEAISRYQLRGRVEGLSTAVEVDGRTFWLRNRRLSSFEVPYDLGSQWKVDTIEQLSIWISYLKGREHGEQRGAAEYTRYLVANSDEVRREVRDLYRAYLNRVRQIRDEFASQGEEQ